MYALTIGIALSVAAANLPVDLVFGDYRTVGLSDDEGAEFRGRVEEELNAIGIRVRVPDAVVSQECLQEPECVQQVVGDTAGLVDVEIMRVGPFLQVKFRLFDPASELLFDEEGMEDADVLVAGGTLLPDGIAEKVGASGLPLAPEQLALPAAPTEPEPTEEVAAVTTEESSLELPPLGLAGVALATGGVLLVAVGSVLAFGEASVLEDPASLGADKERARVFGPTALGLAAIGTLVMGGGGTLATIGFQQSSP
jgi:hypothetical protein